jgi:hypothetical protein
MRYVLDTQDVEMVRGYIEEMMDDDALPYEVRAEYVLRAFLRWIYQGTFEVDCSLVGQLEHFMEEAAGKDTDEFKLINTVRKEYEQ